MSNLLYTAKCNLLHADSLYILVISFVFNWVRLVQASNDLGGRYLKKVSHLRNVFNFLGICALANVLPEEVSELQKLYHENRIDEAQALQHRLLIPNATVTKGLGVPALKKSMDWLGYYGGPVRRPLLPLSDTEEAHLQKVFRSEHFVAQ